MPTARAGADLSSLIAVRGKLSPDRPDAARRFLRSAAVPVRSIQGLLLAALVRTIDVYGEDGLKVTFGVSVEPFSIGFYRLDEADKGVDVVFGLMVDMESETAVRCVSTYVLGVTPRDELDFFLTFLTEVETGLNGGNPDIFDTRVSLFKFLEQAPANGMAA